MGRGSYPSAGETIRVFCITPTFHTEKLNEEEEKVVIVVVVVAEEEEEEEEEEKEVNGLLTCL